MIEPIVIPAGHTLPVYELQAFRNLNAPAGALAKLDTGRTLDLGSSLREHRGPFGKVEFTAPTGVDLRLEVLYGEVGELGGPAQVPATPILAVTTLQATAAIATAIPVDGDTSGIALVPGMESLQVYFSGGSLDVQVRVQSAAGKWHLAETLPASTIPGVYFRQVQFPGGRIHFRAADNNINVEIDVARRA